ncbi:MAG TPA: transglycosylase domain-containing protein [Micromonosporaceae bacterium]
MNSPEAQRRAKRRRQLNMLIASFAVFIMLTGIGVVSFTWFATQVVLPSDLPLPLASTVYYRDGKTQLAKLGEVNRTFVKIEQIPDHVQKAVAAAEDRNFYRHSGVDYVGIIRAAWNNLTGGDRQGASTITQQYAKNAMNLQGGYDRKVREAILASKLNDKYGKDEIMQHYLNTIYFGRGAYGIEAAAQAYFGKSVDKLTVAEGAVLAAVIKQPNPSDTHKGYDPAENPEGAKERWQYVLNGMVSEGWLPAAERPTEYPEVKPKNEGCAVGCGLDQPVGIIVKYIVQELAAMGLCDSLESCESDIKERGYRITTSIDKRIQSAAEAIAWRTKKGSLLEREPENLMAAVVAISPKNGQVLAYLGGGMSGGYDYAGKNLVNGQVVGGHPPGSTFKVYTLAAAVNERIHVESHWDARDYKVPGTEITVRNAGRDVRRTCDQWCTLEYSTIQSYNVPFYHVTTQIGPDKVVDMAKAAGITMMWNTADGKPYDLTKVSGKDVAPNPFFNVVGYGQYPVTVLDHTNGLATLANRGRYFKAHFVVSVEQKNMETGEWVKVGGEQLKGEQRIRPEVVDDVTSVLQQIPPKNGRALKGGRPAAGKTGTWELRQGSRDNGHAWMVGYTPQIAASVWVGNKEEQKPLKDRRGNTIGSNNLPSEIWERFMNEAHKGLKVERFPDRKGVGDPNAGNGTSPPPPEPTPEPGNNCLIPFFCPPDGGNGNGNGNGDGQQPPGGGGGILPSPTPLIRRE